MIICSNCGATNSESDGRICRKCGALLPIGNRPPRIRVAFNKKEEKKIQQQDQILAQQQSTIRSAPNPEVQFFSHKENFTQKMQPNLQEIPKVQAINTPKISATSHAGSTLQQGEQANLSKIPDNLNEIPRTSGLQEITPSPFRSTIIPHGGISSPQIAARQLESIPERGSIMSATPASNPPPQVKSRDHNPHLQLKKPQDSETSLVAHKRLEEEMSGLLSELSNQFYIPETKTEKKNIMHEKLTEEKLAPTSMVDILKELLTIDNRIEAIALIQNDGTILSSILSSNITDGLFSTIGRTLSIIGTDIISGLNAGELRSISIRGTDGLLNLAPINMDSLHVKSMFLIMFSNKRVKSGVITIASNKVKRLIKQYLGLDHQEKASK
ncbi:MAG: hypothetical protein ACTSR8_11640 [Promethearchaeota archaeon]